MRLCERMRMTSQNPTDNGCPCIASYATRKASKTTVETSVSLRNPSSCPAKLSENGSLDEEESPDSPRSRGFHSADSKSGAPAENEIRKPDT